MGTDEKYAIYVYYDVAGTKPKSAPLLWYDPEAGGLRAYLPGPDGLAERAIVLLTQSVAGYLDNVAAAALDDAMPYGSFFNFVDKKSWLLQLKQQAKAGLDKSMAIEIDLPDIGGAIASRTGVLVSSADLGEMLGIRNIQDPAVSAIASIGFEKPMRWHALCFKARMKNVTPDLQDELTDVVTRALAGI